MWWKFLLGLPVDVGAWLLTALRWVVSPPLDYNHFPTGLFFLRSMVFGLLCGWFLHSPIAAGLTEAGLKPPGAVWFFSLAATGFLAALFAAITLLLSALVDMMWPRGGR